MMSISVIIPAYNEENYIKETLEYVLKNAPENLLEIIVVNNASTDKTAEVVKKIKGVKLINEFHKGLTIARQRGLTEAKGDLLAYIDADTHIPENWFKIVNREFELDSNLVGLSGPYIYYGLPKWRQKGITLYWNTLAAPLAKITGFMMNGGNFVAKKEALLKIGGFDTNISFYGEDADTARRLSKVGKVKLLSKLYVFTSPRRFEKEGTVRTGAKYAFNYLSEVFLAKPATKEYKDIR